MSDIYKVCELNDSNNISKITVFYGESDLDVQKLFLENPSNSVFENVFSKSELENITSNNIPVQFTAQSIYSDDTIQNIKKKIINAYSSSIAFEEMYLFSKQIQNFNNITTYESLTHNNYFSITQDILFQLLSNLLLSQGGRGHCTVNYSGTQRLISTIFYTSGYAPRGL